MTHHIYQTEGFIVEGKSVGESNKYFYIFTRELGMIDATAQSVRETKSKLRFSLRDLSFSEIAVVRGKNSWKITSAKEIESLYEHLKHDRPKLSVCSQVFALLKRLLRGEEKNEQLFDLLKSAFLFFSHTTLTDEEVRDFECVLVLSILHTLGYVGDQRGFGPFLVPSVWNTELLKSASPLRKDLLTHINRSLKESHL